MITLAGLSHHTAPIEVREQLAPDADALPLVLARAREALGPSALLSTCNRLELYVMGHHEPNAVRAFLATALGGGDAAAAEPFHVLHDLDAVRHLYGVASGIDSMVLGEPEVLGQVRAAFSSAVAAGNDDVVLSHLFHTAIRTGRRARTETGIGTGALSVSSIATQQARAWLQDLTRASVLVIGAGEAGQLAAQSLVEFGVGEVVVANRTLARAQALAAALGGRAIPFDAIPDALDTVQVVIAAADAPRPLVSAETVAAAMQRRDGAPLLLIDIGVPRDIEPGVRDLAGVQYFDVDDLEAIADRNSTARSAETGAVERIVDEEVARFATWFAQRDVIPTIAALTEHAEQLRQREVQKTLRRVRPELADATHVQELLDVLSKAMVRQLLADPIAVLREQEDADLHAEVVQRLFRLAPPADRADRADRE